MKKLIIGINVVFLMALAGNALAEEKSHDMKHAMTMGNTVEEMGEGEIVHSGVVEGYHFSYHLTDIREKMRAMKAAGHTHEGMEATHHLMVYIETPDGTPLEDAQVGFLVEGSSATIQKLMCMEMGGGYGSDVNLGGTDEYIIKTKVVAGEVKLIDEFTLPAK